MATLAQVLVNADGEFDCPFCQQHHNLSDNNIGLNCPRVDFLCTSCDTNFIIVITTAEVMF